MLFINFYIVQKQFCILQLKINYIKLITNLKNKLLNLKWFFYNWLICYCNNLVRYYVSKFLDIYTAT